MSLIIDQKGRPPEWQTSPATGEVRKSTVRNKIRKKNLIEINIDGANDARL